MRIFIITKRQYTSKDLIDDKYGRLREIPLGLAARGHKIYGFCLSYQWRPAGLSRDSNEGASVDWTTINVGIIKPIGFAIYAIRILFAAKRLRPNLIFASSDSVYGILGAWLSHRLDIPCVFDLYDNYESFSAIRIPGVRRLYERVLKNIDLVTCVSDPLQKYIRTTYRPDLPILTLVNATDPAVFTPLDRDQCRRRVGLPLNGTLIGVTGAISLSRGIEDLFGAFEILRGLIPDLYLVLAGKLDKNVSLPSSAKLIYLGLLPQKIIPFVINSFDVSVICNKDSAFGRYCFPQKFVEIISCKVPLVATNVGAIKALLEDYPKLVYETGDSQQLADCISAQLTNRTAPRITTMTWDNIAEKLDNKISQL